MEVILKLGTKAEPGCKVIVKADVRFTDTASFDQWLKAQKVGRDWLRDQKVAGK